MGVTREGEEKTLPWVKKNGVEHAYAFDPNGKLHGWAGVNGIPHAVLLDPQGTVVWSGHPGGLEESKVEEVLAGALTVPLWEWPPEAGGLRDALVRREYAAALQQATEVRVPVGGVEASAFVRGRVANLVSSFDAAVKSEEYMSAFRLGERLKKELSGLPEGQEIAERLAELDLDEDVKKRLQGEERLADLERSASEARTVRDAEKVRADLASLAGEFPGTKIERRAKALVADIDRALQRSRR